MNKAASVNQYMKMINPQQRLLQQQMQEESLSNLDSDQPSIVLRSYNPNRKLRRIRDDYAGFCTTRYIFTEYLAIRSKRL